MHVPLQKGKARTLGYVAAGAAFVFLAAMFYGFFTRGTTPKPTSEFKQAFPLKLGERTPTIWLDPGKTFYIKANKPYYTVSFATRPETRFEKPAGWSDVTGLAPAGCLFLEAIEERTIIQCIHRDSTPNQCIPLKPKTCVRP